MTDTNSGQLKAEGRTKLLGFRVVMLLMLSLSLIGFTHTTVPAAVDLPAASPGRKQNWLDRNGSNLGGGYETRVHYGRSYIFAWLEKGQTSDPSGSGLGTISNVIHGTGPYDEGLIDHDNSAGTTAGLNLLRLILQYPDLLPESDSAAIHAMFESKVTHDYSLVSRMGAVGSSHSTQPQRTTEAFLYASLFKPDAQFTLERYEDWTANCPDCSGTHYQVGHSYSTIQFTRDLLLNGMQNWVTEGNGEFDGNYTHLLVEAMLLLYDFSPDTDMKERARLVLDFMMLEQAMDFAFGQNAGAQGRNYRANILRNVYIDKGFYPLLGIGSDRYGSISGGYYVTSYQVPELIRNVIDIGNEPDTYWRIHQENNHIANLDGSTGKWTFVTPNFTIGMAESNTQRWQVTLRATDNGVFKLWIDGEDNSGDPGDSSDDWTLGTNTAIQYRSSLHLQSNRDHLHVVKGNHTFDEGESNLVPYGSGYTNDYKLDHSSWNFFLEGKTALAIQMGSGFAAIELATLGVEYPDFESFKAAVETNASANRNSFTNSRGEVLTQGQNGGSINGRPIWDFPFARMETFTSAGQVVYWSGSTMKVSDGSTTCSYDFSQWETTGNGCSQSTPQTVFQDVPNNHPYHDEIIYLYEHGYTAGCSSSPLLFCPEQILNRAESAVFMVRGRHGASFNPSIPGSEVFDDVDSGEWYFRWVHTLYEDSLTAGCGTSPLIYCPSQEHSIAEGSVFNLRILYGEEYTPPPAEGLFADAPVDTWYAKYVEAAYLAGLIEPCEMEPELRICPEETLSRALDAHMLYQALTSTP
ncbi:MAG: hypothetical protein JXA25_08580 [Anaerolineales bacterium]|nr:hypothetical protein [Anaerolineales bacterium]